MCSLFHYSLSLCYFLPFLCLITRVEWHRRYCDSSCVQQFRSMGREEGTTNRRQKGGGTTTAGDVKAGGR